MDDTVLKCISFTWIKCSIQWHFCTRPFLKELLTNFLRNCEKGFLKFRATCGEPLNNIPIVDFRQRNSQQALSRLHLERFLLSTFVRIISVLPDKLQTFKNTGGYSPPFQNFPPSPTSPPLSHRFPARTPTRSLDYKRSCLVPVHLLSDITVYVRVKTLMTSIYAFSSSRR